MIRRGRCDVFFWKHSRVAERKKKKKKGGGASSRQIGVRPSDGGARFQILSPFVVVDCLKLR